MLSGEPRRYSGLDDDRSACVFASEVAVLVKKERVDREDPASFSFSFVLPETLTPTFRVSQWSGRFSDRSTDRSLARSCALKTRHSSAQGSSGQYSAEPFSTTQRSTA